MDWGASNLDKSWQKWREELELGEEQRGEFEWRKQRNGVGLDDGFI